MKKRKIIYYLIFIATYLIMLALLTVFECGAEGASISNYFEAIWYSLTTLTTVGYGDFYPVTAPGRILGLLFMIMSAGFFGFTISLFIAKLSGVFIPTLLMKMNRKVNWYIFPAVNDNSLCLALSISECDEDALIIFCNRKNQKAVEYNIASKAIFAELSVAEILKMKKGIGRSYIVSMGKNALADCQQIIASSPAGTEVFCETDMYVDCIPAQTHLFNHYMCTSRYLWSEYPLTREEKKIVIIGCDDYGNEIIEQALLVNTDTEIGKREYHIFGNVENFLARHKNLSACFGINEKIEGKDSLYFYEDDPFAYLELLQNADRTIVCGDDDSENIALLGKICKYIPVRGELYVRENTGLTFADKEVVFFGSDKAVLSFDVVIRDRYTKKARQMHEDYCRQNPGNSVSWEQLTNFTRCSNLSVADHIPTKLRILIGDENPEVNEERLNKAREIFKRTRQGKADIYRKIEHERWMRFHILNNWSYSSERDNAGRKHNMLIPYEKLSPEEQAKDDYGWEIL